MIRYNPLDFEVVAITDEDIIRTSGGEDPYEVPGDSFSTPNP